MDKIFLLCSFIFILVISRIIPHPPNFTPIIAAAIFGPIFFKDRILGLAIPIIGMFISDLIIGFHAYQIVIYLTLISISLLIPKIIKLVPLSFYALFSCLWFFLTTNLAVWLVWEYYPKTFDGLISCFVLAIPFFKNTLISTIIFTITFYYLNKIYEKSTFRVYLSKAKLLR